MGIILLTANLKTLVSRTKMSHRPRVILRTSLEQDFSLLWRTYKDRYYRAANFIYRTGCNKTVKQEADEIIQILKKKALIPPENRRLTGPTEKGRFYLKSW